MNLFDRRGAGESLAASPAAPVRRRNLSPTRAPATPHDLALWPSWTRLPIERIGFTLLNEDGTPVTTGGGN